MSATFKARATYDRGSDSIEVRVAPDQSYGERVTPHLTVHRSMATNAIIGATVHDVLGLLKERRISKAPSPPEGTSFEGTFEHYRRYYEEHPDECHPPPSVWYNRDGDSIEIIFENEASVAHGLPNQPVTTHRERKTRRLVGLDINMVTSLIRAAA